MFDVWFSRSLRPKRKKLTAASTASPPKDVREYTTVPNDTHEQNVDKKGDNARQRSHRRADEIIITDKSLAATHDNLSEEGM